MQHSVGLVPTRYNTTAIIINLLKIYNYKKIEGSTLRYHLVGYGYYQLVLLLCAISNKILHEVNDPHT